jgi:hypothetical protein
VTRRIAFLNYRANDAFAVDDKGYAGVDRAFVVENAVRPARGASWPVTEKREFQLLMFAKVVRGSRSVNANAQNLGTGRDEVVLDLSEAAEFVRSAAGKSHRVEGEHHLLLAAEIRQTDLAALSII